MTPTTLLYNKHECFNRLSPSIHPIVPEYVPAVMLDSLVYIWTHTFLSHDFDDADDS